MTSESKCECHPVGGWFLCPTCSERNFPKSEEPIPNIQLALEELGKIKRLPIDKWQVPALHNLLAICITHLENQYEATRGYGTSSRIADETFGELLEQMRKWK